MGLPQLESCCFVLDLKTGNVVMGCLNALMSFTLVVSFIVAASWAGEEREQILGPEEMAAITGFYAMSIILVFMFIAKFCFDIVFVYGVIAERANIIKAYFVMWIVFFLLSMFTFFVNVMQYSAWTVTVENFYIGLNVYAILLSHSYYKQLNMREDV